MKMTRFSVIMVLLGLSACNKGAPEAPAPTTDGDAVNARGTTDTGTEGDADAGTADAGEGPSRDRFVLTEETPVDELNELVKHLKNRIQEIDLREREVIQREQMVASLEAATMQQVDLLWKLKSQVAVLLEKVGDNFKDERQAYELKVKKEEEARIKKEKEAEALRQKKAEELKQASQELGEERERHIVHLTAAIKGMRASAGASMLASMDETDAVSILRQLGSRQAAALLGGMQPDKAAQLAEAMLGPKPIAPNLIDVDGKSKTTEEK
jgi:flagellar motility protein MotE (MotC chaperone)